MSSTSVFNLCAFSLPSMGAVCCWPSHTVRIFTISSCVRGIVGRMDTFGSLIRVAGLDSTHCRSCAKRKNARSRSSFLPAVRGPSFHVARNRLNIEIELPEQRQPALFAIRFHDAGAICIFELFGATACGLQDRPS